MEGDEAGLVELLAADVVAYGDGGGRAPTISRPVYGRERVARLLMSPTGRGAGLGIQRMRLVEVNGQPGAVLFGSEDRPLAVVTVDVADDLVQTVRAVTNPRQAGPPPRVHRSSRTGFLELPSSPGIQLEGVSNVTPLWVPVATPEWTAADEFRDHHRSDEMTARTGRADR